MSQCQHGGEQFEAHQAVTLEQEVFALQRKVGDMQVAYISTYMIYIYYIIYYIILYYIIYILYILSCI